MIIIFFFFFSFSRVPNLGTLLISPTLFSQMLIHIAFLCVFKLINISYSSFCLTCPQWPHLDRKNHLYNWHSCNYPISHSSGKSSMQYTVMQIQVKSFTSCFHQTSGKNAISVTSGTFDMLLCNDSLLISHLL